MQSLDALSYDFAGPPAEEVVRIPYDHKARLTIHTLRHALLRRTNNLLSGGTQVVEISLVAQDADTSGLGRRGLQRSACNTNDALTAVTIRQMLGTNFFEDAT